MRIVLSLLLLVVSLAGLGLAIRFLLDAWRRRRDGSRG